MSKKPCEPCKKARNNLPLSVAQTSKNLANSLQNGKHIIAPHAIKQKRLAACEQCDSVKRFHGIQGATIGMLDVCTEKGYLIVAAARIESEQCPLNHWSE